jgi:hypothetical protein
METTTIAQENSDSEAGPDAGPGARRSDRSHMIKAAQIAFGGSVLDCALLDVSPDGARVFLRALADVPNLVTLTLPGGESRPMRCRWQIGLQVGLEVVGTVNADSRTLLEGLIRAAPLEDVARALVKTLAPNDLNDLLDQLECHRSGRKT